MSQYPCEVCATTVPGTLDACYVRVLLPSGRFRRKLRFCRPHCQEFLGEHDTEWEFVHPIYGIQTSETCRRCGLVPTSRTFVQRLFCDIYAKGQDRSTWVSTYCLVCAEQIVVSLDLELEPDRHLTTVRSPQVMDDRGHDHPKQSKGSRFNGRIVLNQDHGEAANDNENLKQEPQHRGQ